MTIKQQGGVFGRHPSFKSVEADTVQVNSLTPQSIPVVGSDNSLSEDTDLTWSGNNIIINRGSNGAHIRLQSSGSDNGYFGVFNTNPYWVTNNGGIRLDAGGGAVRPVNSGGANNDGAIDLGTSSSRFANAYLSGNVIVASGKGIDFSATAGTGTSELFDDYEEGEVNLSTTAADVDIEGNYVKAGRMVTVTIAINPASGDTTWATGDTITGLPYAAATTSSAAGGTYNGGQYYGGYMMTLTTMRGRFYVSGTSLTIIDGFGTSTNYSASFTYISET